MDAERSGLFGTFGNDGRTHLPQGCDHPLHRALGER